MSHFTGGKTEASKRSNLPKITQLVTSLSKHYYYLTVIEFFAPGILLSVLCDLSHFILENTP